MTGSAVEGLPAGRRVLLVNYEFPPLGGGAANATANLAREMAAAGVEVRVLTSRFAGLPEREEIGGVSVFRIRTGRRRADRSSIAEMLAFLLASLPAAALMARRWRPDATIAFFGLPCGPAGWLLKILYGIPYLVSLRGGDVPGFAYDGISLYHRLSGPVISHIWRDARAVVANSDGLAALARRFAPDQAVPIIPNGVDTDLFTPAEGRMFTSAEGRSGAPVLRLLFVGRLVRQKGLDLLFQALASLPDPASVTLRLVGDGDSRAELEAQAAALDIRDRVDFAGWIDRPGLPGLYRNCDAFVFTSRNEGMPNVVLEAMAAGLPVLATRISGNEELVVDGESGLLIPPEDIEALAAGIARLAGDPALRDRLGAAARQRVLAHYSWRAASERYLALAGLTGQDTE